jgi:peroxiredoxin
MMKPLVIIPGLLLAATLLNAQTPSAKATGSKKATAASATAVKSTTEKPAVAPAKVPRPSGEFVINMPDGSSKLLSSYRGKMVVLAFMYTTCTHCQHMAGVLNKVQADFAGKGVQVLGVTFDPTAQRDVATFNKLYATGFTCGWAPEAMVKNFMHVTDYYVPMLAFIDRTGTIRSQIVVTNPNPDDPSGKFLSDPENNVPKEINKYLNAASNAAPKQTPKSE